MKKQPNQKLLALTIAIICSASSALAQYDGIFGYGLELKGTGANALNSGITTLYALDNGGTTRLLPVGSSATLNQTSWSNGTPEAPIMNLGTFYPGAGDSLTLKGGSMLTYQGGGATVGNSIYLNYAIDPLQGPYGNWVGNDLLGVNQINVNGTTGDTRWSDESLSVNLLSGLSRGTYVLESYGYANSSLGDLYASDGGSNYGATFNVNPGPVIYGYLSKFPSQSSTTSSNEVAWMAKYHINYVQFYDWQWKHHVPLAGTVTSPATSWSNVANLTCYRQTVQDMISACHSNGMYAMEYNLMYGAWAGYGQDGSGVNSNWSLLTSINGPQWSISMPAGWATSAIYIFNPGNTNWQNYLFSRENDMFSDYGFDGWHLDQLGDWGTMYDVNGNSVDVWTTFAGFLNNAKAATGKRLTFNNVGAYGMYSVCADTSDDAVYVECWPANGQTTYQDLKTTIDNGISWSGGKAVVLAAYMDTDLTSGNFSAPGVLLTDAAIFASGGTHLELGDGGFMLSTPYFPNENVSLSTSLANTLTNYYNFIINNQTNLYGGFANSGNVIWTSVSSSGSATAGEVWAFCKVKNGVSMLNLINLIGETSIDWQDVNGTYPVPTAQTNFTAKYYYGSTAPSSVKVSSPDINNGTAQSLSFTQSSDGGGNFVQFTVPRLAYWDMIIVQ